MSASAGPRDGSSSLPIVCRLPPRPASIAFRPWAEPVEDGTTMLQWCLARIGTCAALTRCVLVCDPVDESLLAATVLPEPWRLVVSSSLRPLDAVLDAATSLDADVVVSVELEAALCPPDVWALVKPAGLGMTAGLWVADSLPPRVTPCIVNVRAAARLRQAFTKVAPPQSVRDLFAFAAAAGLTEVDGLSCLFADLAPSLVERGRGRRDVRFDSGADVQRLSLVARHGRPELDAWEEASRTDEAALRLDGYKLSVVPAPHPRGSTGTPRLLFTSSRSAFSGVESSTLEVIRALRRCGVEVGALIGYEGHWAQSLRDIGCTVFCSNETFDEESLRALSMCTEVLARWKPDVVHDCGNSGLAGSKAAFAAGVPVVFHAHVPVPEAYENIPGWADRFIAVSLSAASALVTAGADPSLIRVVANGVEPTRYDDVRSGREEERRHLGISANAFTILTLARFSPEKRLCDVVDALALLRRVLPDVVLVMAGESHSAGSTYRAVLDQIAANGLEQAVRLTGFHGDVRALLGAADVLVLCSEYEAFGMVALEALASRVPLIATPVGEMPRLVGSMADADACGLRVEIGNPLQMRDALLTVKAGGPGLTAMSRRGREIVERSYTAERSAGALLDIYREILR